MGARRSETSARAVVRMVAQPASVPAARRFVSDTLATWGCDSWAEDVTLCVSELATNATLHSGSTYFQIELEKRRGAVRLAVADAGMEPVDVLARQPEFSDAFLGELSDDTARTTGRGMFLVSALATLWGIDELPAGKRVWGEFGPEQSASAVEDTTSSAPRLAWSGERHVPPLDPEGWAVVRFRRCPAALLVAHDENLDEYTRELNLIGARLGEPSFQRLADVLAGYRTDHSANWDPARIIAREAVRDGRELVDFDVLADKNIRESIQFLRNLIWEAEALSRQGKLMTLPAAEPVQRLRDWMEAEFLEQIEDGAQPLPYAAWSAGQRR